MEKELFVKMVLDTNKINGFYMDDYTADLLWGHFYEIEFEELQRVLMALMKSGEKVTYKSLINNIRKKKIKEKIEIPKEHIEDCEEDCKICQRDVICQKMNRICGPIVAKVLKGDYTYDEAREILHKEFPTAGFDKKIGTITGVVENENGEYISVYRYD
jgi:hypothetical protein